MVQELHALAGRLLRTAGSTEEATALTRLAGGRNNRVFRLDRANASPLLLKLYHHDPRDTRNRLDTEWSFLRHAWDVCGLRDVPQPLAVELARHAALYPFVSGSRLAMVELRHVEAAARFVAALNRPAARDRAAALAPGSEACFSMASHLTTIAGRVRRLAESLDPAAPYATAAAALVHDTLVPTWERLARTLPRDETEQPWCVSPSDFGFHNALAEGERVVFLDFEYAGRDDPAKLVCDFFCQPEVPAPPATYPEFRDAVLAALGLDTNDQRARCNALLPAYRLKWACIMLNDFLAADAARRDFAEGQDRATRCATQLAKATDALARLHTP